MKWIRRVLTRQFFGRVFVGFCVNSGVVCLAARDVEQGFTLIYVLLLIAIVCTAGIGLVVLVLIWWCVGWATLKIVGIFTASVGAFKNRSSTGRIDDRPVSRPAPVVRPGELALAEYIRQAQANGMGQDEMTRIMLLNGWSTAEIQRARQNVVSSTP